MQAASLDRRLTALAEDVETNDVESLAKDVALIKERLRIAEDKLAESAKSTQGRAQDKKPAFTLDRDFFVFGKPSGLKFGEIPGSYRHWGHQGQVRRLGKEPHVLSTDFV